MNHDAKRLFATALDRALTAETAQQPSTPCPDPDLLKIPFLHLPSDLRRHLTQCPSCRQIYYGQMLLEPARELSSPLRIETLMSEPPVLTPTAVELLQADVELRTLLRREVERMARADDGILEMIGLNLSGEERTAVSNLLRRREFGPVVHFAKSLIARDPDDPAPRLFLAYAAVAANLPGLALSQLRSQHRSLEHDSKWRSLAPAFRALAYLALGEATRAAVSLRDSAVAAAGLSRDEIVHWAATLLREVELIRLPNPGLPNDSGLISAADADREPSWVEVARDAIPAWIRDYLLGFVKLPPELATAARRLSRGDRRDKLAFNIVDLSPFQTAKQHLAARRQPDHPKQLWLGSLPQEYRDGRGYLVIMNARGVRQAFPDLTFDNEERIMQTLFETGRLLELDDVLIHVEAIPVQEEGGDRGFWLSIPTSVEDLIRDIHSVTAVVILGTS